MSVITRGCQYRQVSGEGSARVADTARARRVPVLPGESPARVRRQSEELAERARCRGTTARIGTGAASTLDTTTTSLSTGDTASADTVRIMMVGIINENFNDVADEEEQRESRERERGEKEADKENVRGGGSYQK